MPTARQVSIFGMGEGTFFLFRGSSDGGKGDIITDEELEKIGVIYGTKARYERAM